MQIFGKVLEKRFEVKQTGHIGFNASDAKEFKILNRTIKIDVLNDEMTLEAGTKLVKNALETMKLNGAKGVVSVSKTPQMTCFRGAKVCSKWLKEKVTIKSYSLTTSSYLD